MSRPLRLSVSLTISTLPVMTGVVLGGLLLAGGGMGLLVPSLTDGVGEAVPEAVRGRSLGGLSMLRNLGRFAAPVLTAPTLVGSGSAAPLVGVALLAGGLGLLLLGWTDVCRVRPTVLSSGGAASRSQSAPQPSLCNP